MNKLELLLLEKLFVSKNTDCWVGEANGFVFDLACLVATVKKEWSGSSTVLHEQLVVLGERMQSDVEKMGMAPLKKLHNNDLSFLDDEGEKLEFLYFLCTQYFRTKGLKDEVRDDMGKESYRIIECFQKELGDECDYSIDWSALYNYGCYCLALSCASSLLKNDIHFKLLLSQKTRFIVSDQPVYNSGNHLEGELRFFYPISPYQAVIGSTEFLQNEVIEIGDSDVLLHNDNTLKHTYKFFMGKEESDVNFDYPY